MIAALRRTVVARSCGGRCDEGTALVEFFWLGILLLVPITYAILFAFQVQRASFAVTEATRSAARAFVTTPRSAADGASQRAIKAAQLTIADHGLPPLTDSDIVLTCGAPGCFEPGASLHVEIGVDVELPGLAAIGVRGRAVHITGIHDEVFDVYERTPALP